MLKKPIVALILCVIVVISSTVISVHSRLDANCAAVSEVFTASGGISDQLDAVCTASRGIVKLAEKYELEDYKIFEAADLCTTIRISIGDQKPSELYYLYRMLLTQVDDLRTSLRLKDLSADDAERFTEFETSYLSAQTAIGSSGYNQFVSTYLRELGAFPRFMARLCGVRLPEQFA